MNLVVCLMTSSCEESTSPMADNLCPAFKHLYDCSFAYPLVNPNSVTPGNRVSGKELLHNNSMLLNSAMSIATLPWLGDSVVIGMAKLAF